MSRNQLGAREVATWAHTIMSAMGATSRGVLKITFGENVESS